MKTTIDFIWDADCPNVKAARANLMTAISRASVSASWSEWQIGDDAMPDRARGFGSPTILINGQDVGGATGGKGESCRLYQAADGKLGGVPEVDTIAAALVVASSEGADVGGPPAPRFSWRSAMAMAPGVGLALLPKVTCPACWPAYAGVLSAVGLGFLMETRYLLPLTSLFLAIALFFLAFRARRRRGFGPFVGGLVAAGVLMIGKFVFESDPAMYVGVAGLMASSLWNSWPRKDAEGNAAQCSTCDPVINTSENVNRTLPSCCGGAASQHSGNA